MNEDPIGVVAVPVISVLMFLVSHVFIRRTEPSKWWRLVIDVLAGSLFLFAIVSACVMRGFEYALTQAVIIGFFAAAFVRLVVIGIWYGSDKLQADFRTIIDESDLTADPYLSLPEYFLHRVGGFHDEAIIVEALDRHEQEPVEFFHDVATPYAIDLLSGPQDDEQLEAVFSFFEYMASHEDNRIRDLLDDVVCTGIAAAGPGVLSTSRRYMGPATLDFSHRNAVESGY